jgi:hypothetical protein
MNQQESLSAPMIALLTDSREILNARFQQKRASGVKVDPQVWSSHIVTVIAPIVDSVHRLAEERSRVTLIDLYDVSLDLFAAGHFSESGSSLLLFQLWKDILPKCAKILSRSPRRIAGSLSNAVLALTMESSGVAQRWLGEIKRTSNSCENPQQLLELGKLLAWTAGMAHYRLPALALAKQLQLPLLRTVFQIAEAVPENSIRNWLTELEFDPWAQLLSGNTPRKQKVEQVAICGAFRGFGGLFLEPPKVFIHRGQIYVSENQTLYRLVVDRFGHSLQRAGNVEAEKPSATSSPQIDSKGIVNWEGCEALPSNLRGLTSQAFDGKSLAVTISDSFHIFLYAKRFS